MSSKEPVQSGQSAEFVSSGRGAWIVSLWGEHDITSEGRVRSLLTRLAADGYDIVVDLSRVTFMDASTMRALRHGCSDASAKAATLRVRAPSPFTYKLLEICDLAAIIESPSDAQLAPQPR